MSHEERATEREAEADRLEEQSSEVSDRIEDVKGDWEAKKGDSDVPGALPPEEEIEADQTGPGVGSKEA